MFNWNRPCFVSSISLYWDIHFKVDVGLFKHLQIYNLFLIILLYRKLIFFTFVQKYIRHKECHRVNNRLLTWIIIIHIQEKKRRLENKVNLTRISIISFLSVTMYTNWNAYSFLAVKYDLFILLKICGYFYIVYCSIYVVVFYCFMCAVFV